MRCFKYCGYKIIMNGGLFMQTLKTEIKDKILIEARRIFHQKGFEKTSMREIAEASGITVGNVYRYFKNKNELFYAVVQEAHEAITHIVQSDHSDNVIVMDNHISDTIFLEKVDPTLNDIIDVFVKYKVEITILVYKSHGSELGMMIDRFTEMIIDKVYTQVFHHSEGNAIDMKLLSKSLALTCIQGITEICNSNLNDEEMYKSIYGLLMFLFMGAKQRLEQIERRLVGGLGE